MVEESELKIIIDKYPDIFNDEDDDDCEFNKLVLYIMR